MRIFLLLRSNLYLPSYGCFFVPNRILFIAPLGRQAKSIRLITRLTWSIHVILLSHGEAWLMTLFSNGVLFLTDWYLHVTSQTSFSTSSRNRFSTAGLIHNDGRSEMHCSCPSSSKELLEKVAFSVLEIEYAHFKRQMPTSDFSEGQRTALLG